MNWIFQQVSGIFRIVFKLTLLLLAGVLVLGVLGVGLVVVLVRLLRLVLA